MRICVIGAGLFGSMIAVKLAKAAHEVDLIEKESSLLSMASKHNHNRIHFGYHYLRSIETAQESREGLPSFMGIFGSAFLMGFPNYYCMAAEGSKSTSEHFEHFCDKVDISAIQENPPSYILNRSKVSACYRVPEPVFDYFQLYRIVKTLLTCAKVRLHLNTEVQKINANSNFSVSTNNFVREYDIVINATYSGINAINAMLGLPRKKYLYEDVVIPIFRYVHPAFGITIMDGGFCSVEPYGFRPNEFLLYHVQHSVVNRSLGQYEIHPDAFFDEDTIYDESSDYFPFLKRCERIGYYRSIRIVKERDDDARLSIIYNDLPHYWGVLSGKVTTCVDVANKMVKCVVNSGR